MDEREIARTSRGAKPPSGCLVFVSWTAGAVSMLSSIATAALDPSSGIHGTGMLIIVTLPASFFALILFATLAIAISMKRRRSGIRDEPTAMTLFLAACSLAFVGAVAHCFMS